MSKTKFSIILAVGLLFATLFSFFSSFLGSKGFFENLSLAEELVFGLALLTVLYIIFLFVAQAIDMDKLAIYLPAFFAAVIVIAISFVIFGVLGFQPTSMFFRRIVDIALNFVGAVLAYWFGLAGRD